MAKSQMSYEDRLRVMRVVDALHHALDPFEGHNRSVILCGLAAVAASIVLQTRDRQDAIDYIGEVLTGFVNQAANYEPSDNVLH